jgi:hypothetical protein
MGFSLRINSQVVAHDEDEDGFIEPNEITSDGTQDIVENTEMKEAMDELNKDEIDSRGYSSMDLRSRLHYLEIAGVMGLDCLASYHMVSLKAKSITENKKRLAVSLDGSGRKEIVAVATGGESEEKGMAGMGKRFMRGLFGAGKKDGED